MAIEDVSIRHAIFKKKYSKGRNYKFLDIKVALFRLLYYNFTLFRRRTNIWQVEIIVYKDSKVLGNNTFPMHIIIKIISQDVNITLSKREILNKAIDYKNICMPLLIPHIEFTL